MGKKEMERGKKAISRLKEYDRKLRIKWLFCDNTFGCVNPHNNTMFKKEMTITTKTQPPCLDVRQRLTE